MIIFDNQIISSIMPTTVPEGEEADADVSKQQEQNYQSAPVSKQKDSNAKPGATNASDFKSSP